MSAISRAAIGDQIMDRAAALGSTVSIYRGRPPAHPPVLRGSSIADTAGLVAPYLVVGVGSGAPWVNGERDLAERHDDLGAVHTFTCVAGTPRDCEALVDATHDLFFLWSPALPNLAFGRMAPPPGYDPGPPRPDEKHVPPRFYVPLQYRLDVTT